MTAGRIAVGGLVLAGAATGFVKVSAESAPPPQLKAALVQEHRVAWVAPQDRPAYPSAEYVPADFTADGTNPPPPADPVPADQSTEQTGVSTNPADLFDHYVVQPGDTLTHIAAAYGVSWQSLWAANAADGVNGGTLAHPDNLFVGEVLRLPF